jgi:D-3-phosphoglycerate dehydrogenase
MDQEGVIAVTDPGELYAGCQFVSLHIPANEKTKKSINYDLLMKMPKGAMLVNTARKEVICEDSLQKVFAERDDFRYVSDVAPDCLEALKEKFAGRFFVTPKKMGAQTSEANVNAGLAAARQIVDFFEKGDIRFKVN